MEKILSRSRERYERQYALKASGIDLDSVAARVIELLGMDIEQVWQPGRFRPQVQSRSLLCYWAVRELGESMIAMARRLGISTPAVSKAVAQGTSIAERDGYKIVPSSCRSINYQFHAYRRYKVATCKSIGF